MTHMSAAVNICRVLSMVACLTATAGAVADTAYPTKTVRWIVPAPAGGPMDVTARRLAQKISEQWGQQVIVDNRAGGAGIVAALAAMQAAPDGYTILHAHNGMMAINPHVYKSLPYDPFKSFAPVTSVSAGHAIVLVNPEVPAKTLKEFIALLKSKPGQLAFGSSGVGSPPHLTGVMFQKATGTHILHVPYKGSAPILTDLVGGQIQVGFDYIVPMGEPVKAGRLRALAIAGPKRIPYLPDVPTATEAGLPGFESRAWTALYVPAGTPPDIIRKIHDAVVMAIDSPEEQTRAASIGFEMQGSTPEWSRDYMKSELIKWGEVVRASGIQPE